MKDLILNHENPKKFLKEINLFAKECNDCLDKRMFFAPFSSFSQEKIDEFEKEMQLLYKFRINIKGLDSFYKQKAKKRSINYERNLEQAHLRLKNNYPDLFLEQTDPQEYLEKAKKELQRVLETVPKDV